VGAGRGRPYNGLSGLFRKRSGLSILFTELLARPPSQAQAPLNSVGSALESRRRPALAMAGHAGPAPTATAIPSAADQHLG